MKKRMILGAFLVVGFLGNTVTVAEAITGSNDTTGVKMIKQVQGEEVVEIHLPVSSSNARHQITSPINLDDPELLTYEVFFTHGGFQQGDQVYWPADIALSTATPLFVYYNWRTIRNETFSLTLKVIPTPQSVPDVVTEPEIPEPLFPIDPIGPGDLILF